MAALVLLALAGTVAHISPASAETPEAALQDGIPPADLAPIALMMDAHTGQILLARDINRRFIPASITKVMTAYVAFGMLERGEITREQTMPFEAEAFREWGGKGSSMYLAAGSQTRVDDLLRGIATVSANDASIVLARGAAGSVENWTAKMNATARELGMRESHFGTPNGWPDDGATFTTARDLARLARALIAEHPQAYADYFGQRSFSFNGISQDNYDPISGIVPGGDGIKTGFTRQAGNGFLGSAERDGRRLVMVIAGVQELDDRQRLAREFTEWGFAAFDIRTLFESGASIGSARVRGGDSAWVGLRTGKALKLAQWPGQPNKVKLEIRYSGPLEAPVSAGDRVASLRMTVDGVEGTDIPLYATNNVPMGGALDRLRDGLYTLLP